MPGVARSWVNSAGLFTWLVVIGISGPTALAVTVPGTANPWLAGMPDGTEASSGDIAPTHSPVLVTLSSLGSPSALSFTASGMVNHGAELTGPEGGALWTKPTEHSKSGTTSPINALMGVFLDDAVPSGAAPPILDFDTPASRDFTSLSPLLNQVFFIGDGFNSAMVQQTFNVPGGATRLFLGPMDAFGWYNNTGEFEVIVIPEPSSLIGALIGAAAAALARSRRGR
jgi:hypothetical protein